MATYPAPYGGPAISLANCSMGAVHNEMFGAYPTAAVTLEYLIVEGNKMKPLLITEASRPHNLGQFDGFQKYTCDFLFSGPTSDIVRDATLIQNDMGGTEVLVYYDYEQYPSYDMVFKQSSGVNYEGWHDYRLQIFHRPYNDPAATWTLKETINSYKSQVVKTGDGTVPAENSYKTFKVEMVQIKRYGRCYGLTDGFGQAVVAVTDGTHAMDAAEKLLFTSTVYGVQNLTVSDAGGLTVTLYTREKQTANVWSQQGQYLSYAGETISADFQKMDYKIEVTGGASL